MGDSQYIIESPIGMTPFTRVVNCSDNTHVIAP